MGTKNIISSILGRSTPQPKVLVTSLPNAGPGSGVVPSDLEGVIDGTPRGPYSTNGAVCVDAPPDSWDFQWVRLNYSGVAPHSMLADFFVQLPRPVRKLFMVGNNSPTGQALFIHFNKLNKYDGVTFGEIQGTEPWIPFPGCTQFGSVPGGGPFGAGLTDVSYIEFCKPISKFYCTIFNGAGAGPADQGWNITLLASDDVDSIYSNAK